MVHYIRSIAEAKKYPTNHKAFQVLYGLSQNQDTGEYIFVLMWTSGTEAKKYPTNHKAFQVLYGLSQNQDTGEYIFVLMWTSGTEAKKYPTKHKEFQVFSQNSIKSLINEAKKYPSKHETIQAFDKFLNEVKKYSINKTSNILNIYGISQNPDTKEYIMR
ncbi:kinase-like domain-containing protein [Rhizophagus irregularis DAOM 181602=DAOM 197198]|nr:kinase-like domain-containing protein [Rhizophagus irregularis DAOM 181602=DAOM 197198]